MDHGILEAIMDRPVGMGLRSIGTETWTAKTGKAVRARVMDPRVAGASVLKDIQEEAQTCMDLKADGILVNFADRVHQVTVATQAKGPICMDLRADGVWDHQAMVQDHPDGEVALGPWVVMDQATNMDIVQGNRMLTVLQVG
jgi:hypothetical protein